MIKRPLILAVLLAAATLSVLQADAGPNAQFARNVSGNWDFGKKAKGLPMLLTIRQEGNRYPGIYAGINEGGKFSIVGSEDPLTDDLVVQSRGGFTVRMTTMPPKQGMDNLIPGAVWSQAGKSMKVTAEFASFDNWKHVANKRRDNEGVTLEAAFKGTFTANGKSAPIAGTATFYHPHKVGTFSLDARFTLSGSDLDLPAAHAGPLNFRVRTAAPASTDLPPDNNRLIEINTD